MLIRISLIVAILGCLAVAGLNLVTIREKIQATVDERNDWNTKYKTEAEGHRKEKKRADDTQATLDKTKQELTSTKKERDDATAKADAESKRANDVAGVLKTTVQELEGAKNRLAAWDALGVPIEKMKATLDSLASVKAEKEVINDEKKILYAQVLRVQAKLDAIIGDPTHEPDMPEGLRGKVLAVDPKYEFVVLDIGENQGVKVRGRLLVHRNGKLIAKVVVGDVRPDQSIANVMPGEWKISDVMEGDQVLY